MEKQKKPRKLRQNQNETKEQISQCSNLAEKLDFSEAKCEGLSLKERKNLEEIANKYYQQASQLMFDNLILNQKVQQLTDQKAILQTKLAYYQREVGEEIGQQSNQLLNKINRQENDMFMPKRNRRISDKIKKTFVCPITKCSKLYGSYAALYLHFKNKHPDRSMKLIAHSSNTIKVSGQEQEDSFERQMRLIKQVQDIKGVQLQPKKTKKYQSTK